MHSKDNPGGLTEEDIGLILKVHGHLCPMVLLGARIAKRAMQESSPGEDSRFYGMYRGYGCAVDGIQLFTGCTWGNGNLVLLRGKDFSFLLTEEGNDTGVEVSPIPEVLDRIWGERTPEARKVLMDLFTTASDDQLLQAKATSGLGTVSRFPGA
jgi:formylmethanofuran dehydrogenase subunit E